MTSCSHDHDVRKIAAWLLSAGVRATWPKILKRPWPGHDTGALLGGSSLQPDEMLRWGRDHGLSALEGVVSAIMHEGMEVGAVQFAELRSVEMLERQCDRLRRENEELRARVRQLAGEPSESPASIFEIIGQIKEFKRAEAQQPTVAVVNERDAEKARDVEEYVSNVLKDVGVESVFGWDDSKKSATVYVSTKADLRKASYVIAPQVDRVPVNFVVGRMKPA